jgi:hypothetical protein
MDDQRRRSQESDHTFRRCCFETHVITRAIPGRLAQLQIAIAPGPAPRLLVVVQLSSQRTLETVRQDRCFAKQQESHLLSWSSSVAGASSVWG